MSTLTRLGVKPKSWIRKQLEPVETYNRKARERYTQACKEWEPTKGGFPFLGTFVYRDDDGEDYVEGYVVSWQHAEGGRGSRYFETKKAAEEFFYSDEN